MDEDRTAYDDLLGALRGNVYQLPDGRVFDINGISIRNNEGERNQAKPFVAVQISRVEKSFLECSEYFLDGGIRREWLPLIFLHNLKYMGKVVEFIDEEGSQMSFRDIARKLVSERQV